MESLKDGFNTMIDLEGTCPSWNRNFPDVETQTLAMSLAGEQLGGLYASHAGRCKGTCVSKRVLGPAVYYG